MLKKPTLILCGLLLLLSCNPESQRSPNSHINQKVIENPTVNGIWEQEGYGFIIEIKDEIITTYDICKIGCNESFKETLKEQGEIKEVTATSLKIQDGLNEYRFKRLENLPDVCQNTDSLKVNDPIHNFENLWNTFKEHYCYFEDRNIDWQKTYDTYRPQVNASTTDFELFLVMKEMLKSMNDGHVKIVTPEKLLPAYKDYRKKQKLEDGKSKVGTFSYFLASREIANKYLPELNTHNSGVVNWGMLNDDVLFIQVNMMFLLADYGLSSDLKLPELWEQYGAFAERSENDLKDEVDGISKVMKSILEKNKAKAIILDIRTNVGGKDEATQAIMGHFVTKKTKIASKKTKLGDKYSKPLEIYLTPSKPHFSGDLYVLISHRTASAAELLAMSTLSIPKATLVGSSTEGIFSDMLDKKLPNGWEYSLSNEIFLDNDGNNYEGHGISPKISMDYTRDDNVFYEQMKKQIETKDKALELVLDLINNKQ